MSKKYIALVGIVLVLCVAPATATETETATVLEPRVMGFNPGEPYVATLVPYAGYLYVTIYENEIVKDQGYLTDGDSLRDIDVVSHAEDKYHGTIWVIEIRHHDESVDTEDYEAFLPTTVAQEAPSHCVCVPDGQSHCVWSNDAGPIHVDDYDHGSHFLSGQVSLYWNTSGCPNQWQACDTPEDNIREGPCSEGDPGGGACCLSACCGGSIPGMFVIPVLFGAVTLRRTE